jgi:hypothetical protein
LIRGFSVRFDFKTNFAILRKLLDLLWELFDTKTQVKNEVSKTFGNNTRTRVARWFNFKPKVPIWVNFGGPWNGKCRHILLLFGIFTAIWYNLWPFSIVYGHLVYFSQFGMFG